MVWGFIFIFSKCPGIKDLDKCKVFRTSRENLKEINPYELLPFAYGCTHVLTVSVI